MSYQVKKSGKGIPGMHDSTAQLGILCLVASTSPGHCSYGHNQKQLPLAALVNGGSGTSVQAARL